MKLGYAYLVQHCCRSAFLPRVQAEASCRVKALTRSGDTLLVPEAMLPALRSSLDHALFALKHEGTNLQVLSEVLPQIERDEVEAVARFRPNSVPTRKLAYLWEAFTGKALDPVPVSAHYAGLFDSRRYFTAPGERSRKWRIEFNGLGSLRWCAMVEKTPQLLRWLERDPLAEAVAGFARMDPLMADRVLGWASCAEMESTFCLERESASADQMQRIVRCLQQAGEARLSREEDLVRLRNEFFSGTPGEERAYRTEQNWLGGAASGAIGVRYVPPPPGSLSDLMAGWLKAAQELPRKIHPLIAAAVVSFGFVYLHPFMDGNGRLSRFLIAQQLAASGHLPAGSLLPVSVAMAENEAAYLEALESFSRPARSRWKVALPKGDGPLELEFQGSTNIYRFWDATAQAEFLFRMTGRALGCLSAESERILRFDRLERAVNDAFDLVQMDRHALVWAYLERGELGEDFRRRFSRRIPREAMDWLEEHGPGIASGGHNLF